MRTGQIQQRDADASVRHDARNYAESYSDKGGYCDENHNGEEILWMHNKLRQ